jgi:hypothetical protein
MKSPIKIPDKKIILPLLLFSIKRDINKKNYYSKDIKRFVRGSYGSLFVFNKLLIEKRFTEVIELFDSQLIDYTLDKSYSKKMPIQFRQAIPYDQLDCVIEALLKIVRHNFNLKEK